MGTEYYVACRTCKVTRELSKFYGLRFVDDRNQMLCLADEIKSFYSFSAALLASFMWEHKGHDCTVFNEHDESLSEELDPFYTENGFKEDKTYWGDTTQ